MYLDINKNSTNANTYFTSPNYKVHTVLTKRSPTSSLSLAVSSLLSCADCFTRDILDVSVAICTSLFLTSFFNCSISLVNLLMDVS